MSQTVKPSIKPKPKNRPKSEGNFTEYQNAEPNQRQEEEQVWEEVPNEYRKSRPVSKSDRYSKLDVKRPYENHGTPPERPPKPTNRSSYPQINPAESSVSGSSSTKRYSATGTKNDWTIYQDCKTQLNIALKAKLIQGHFMANTPDNRQESRQPSCVQPDQPIDDRQASRQPSYVKQDQSLDDRQSSRQPSCVQPNQPTDSEGIYDDVPYDDVYNNSHFDQSSSAVPVQQERIFHRENEAVNCRKFPKKTIEKCKTFLERVIFTYDYVKVTRLMYEKDDVLKAVLSIGEQKMFNHLAEIEETLYSFKEHLALVVEDVFEVYKLLKEWLEMDYFHSFESYYMDMDIQQNLVTFVEENHPDVHLIFQRKSGNSQHNETGYTFWDLQERFKDPKNWYSTLTYHVKNIKEALHKTCTPEQHISCVEHEIVKLLKEKPKQLVDKYIKKRETLMNHSSTIALRVQFVKNEHALIGQEASLILAEDYATIQGNLLNVHMPKKSPYGRSAYNGDKVYLVVFERAILLTTLEEKKSQRTYNVLECCNRNYVDIERIPQKNPHQPHTFILYIYKPNPGSNTKLSYSTTQYVLALIGNEVNSESIMSAWVNAILVPENTKNGPYESWSRPRYRIRQRYIDRGDTNLTFAVGDEVEVIEETDDNAMCYVERLNDNNKGWIPTSIGRQIENEYKITMDLKQRKRESRANDRPVSRKKLGRRDTCVF